MAFASYVALPFGLALYIPQLAAQHGIRLDVERVRVEPFGSRLMLSGVRVATSGDSSVEWSEVEARIDLATLLSDRRVVLDDFRLSEATVRTGDPRANPFGAWPAVPPALAEAVSVGALVVNDMELATASEALGHPVAIDWIRISSLDAVFQPEGAEVEAKASIGEGRFTLQGRLNVDESGWILDAAEVRANDVPTDGFTAMSGAGGAWHGRLDGAGPMRLVYSPVNSAFNATTGGRWAIAGWELGLAQATVSGARAEWDGAAFATFSGSTLDTLGVDGEVGLHEARVDIDDVLAVEAEEVVLRIDASQVPGTPRARRVPQAPAASTASTGSTSPQTPEAPPTSQPPATRLSMDGRIPAVRLSGKGAVFEAVGAEATNVALQLTLAITEGVAVEVDWLKAAALAVSLPAGRSLDMEGIGLDHVVVESATNTVSAAAGTAERVGWRGLTTPQGTGAATSLAVQRLERQANGGLRLATAVAETVEDRSDDAELRLRDVALDSTTLSPAFAGPVAIGAVRISDAWLERDASTLIVEGLSLGGVERDDTGVVNITSGRAEVVDHFHTGGQTTTGTEVALTGGTVSERGWAAASVRLGEMAIETDDASYTLRGLAVDDAAGEDEQVRARLARLGTLELGSGGSRIMAEGLSADSPTWRRGAGDARTVEAASITLDTVDRHRWRSSGWRVTGVETTASGQTNAATVSLETLALNTAGDSTAGAQRIVLDGLRFDGGSTFHATSARAQRTSFRASGGTDIELANPQADALQWNGETLVAEQGAAPLMRIAAPAASASFDTVAFTSARLGASGMHQLGTVTSRSGQGKVERLFEWTAGGSALGGYQVPASGETMLDAAEMHDVEITGGAGGSGEARLRVDRVIARGARIDASGAAFAVAVVDGIALDDARDHTGATVHTLRASPLTIRGSALAVGALSLAGLESRIGVGKDGDWELPALPIGSGKTRSAFDVPAFGVRIEEATTAAPGPVIRIVDRTTEPDFTARVEVASAALHGLDSEAIGLPTRFSVEASADVFTALQATGVLVPTLTGTDVDLSATVHGLSLPALSPYPQLHLGQTVEGGHADVTLDATVRTSDLEGVADVTLKEVVLGGLDPRAGPPEAGSGSQEASPTLRAVLDALADEQDRIGLRVPLRARLDAPELDLDALVLRALAEAAMGPAEARPSAE